MIKTFKQYAKRRFLEDDGSSVGPSLGGNSNMMGGNTSDARAAFKDLAPAIENSLSGSMGARVLTAMMNTIVSDPVVPEQVKQEIRTKVQEKWSHIVDLSNSPVGQGPGLGNQPSNMAGTDPSMSNIIVPPAADNRGVV